MSLPKFVPEDYVLLKLTPCGYEDKWYRWEQEMPPGSPKALIRAAREFSALKIGYRGDLAFRNAEVINVPKFLTEGICTERFGADHIETAGYGAATDRGGTTEKLSERLLSAHDAVRLCGSDSIRNREALTRRSDYGTSRSRGCQMPVEAQEILEMEVWSLKNETRLSLVCAGRLSAAANGAGSAGATDDDVIGGTS